MYSNSYQGNLNPYSVPVTRGVNGTNNYINPGNFVPPYGNKRQKLLAATNQNYDPYSKFSSNPVNSIGYAMDGSSFITPTSSAQPYRKPGDMFNALNYFDDKSKNVAYLYADNASLQQMFDAVVNDQRVLAPIGLLLNLKAYMNASGFWGVCQSFLNLGWWVLQGPLDPKKNNVKKQLIALLQQMGVSMGGVSESEAKTFFGRMFKDAGIAMGYTRVQVFETSVLKFINSVIAIGVSFDDLLGFLTALCSLIGAQSVAITYSILEAFFKVLIATKSTKVLDVFHSFMRDLIGLGSNNSSNEMAGALKTTRSVFYDAFKTLQKNVNVQQDSVYYLTDDGFIMMKSNSIKDTSVEQNMEAEMAGETKPEIVEATRDMGQIKVVV